MFRILLDSNVIARAVISPNGPAAELLALVVNSEHQLCTSDFMLAELVRVLAYPRLQKRHGLDDQAIVSFVRSIQEVSIVFEVDPQSVPKITRDINDDPVVATAVLSSSHSLPGPKELVYRKELDVPDERDRLQKIFQLPVMPLAYFQQVQSLDNLRLRNLAKNQYLLWYLSMECHQYLPRQSAKPFFSASIISRAGYHCLHSTNGCD